jgi:hypothetical protein
MLWVDADANFQSAGWHISVSLDPWRYGELFI